VPSLRLVIKWIPVATPAGEFGIDELLIQVQCMRLVEHSQYITLWSGAKSHRSSYFCTLYFELCRFLSKVLRALGMAQRTSYKVPNTNDMACRSRDAPPIIPTLPTAHWC